MKNRIYTIYDRVAEECGPIWEAKNDGIAQRGYQKFMAESHSPYFEETDYMLLCIGTVDKTTSLIEPFEPQEVTVNFKMHEEIKDA